MSAYFPEACRAARLTCGLCSRCCSDHSIENTSPAAAGCDGWDARDAVGARRLQSRSIAPWLSVTHATLAVAFYKAAFGAIERERLDDDGGDVAVALLSIDGAELWIQADPDARVSSSARMISSVEDPDAVFARAVAAGGIEIAALHDGHGWRIGRIADPSGHHWEIGRRR